MKTRTVLVVDDSPMDRRLAGAMLEKRGFGVRYAESGQQALAAFAEQATDAVVTDLQMPGMDGLELVGALKSLRPGLPIVLMTAHGSENTAVLALQRGASSFVSKRRLAQELADTVESILELTLDEERISSVDPLELGETIYRLSPAIEKLSDVIGQLEAQLILSKICDETAIMQVGVALREALVNAIVHGNLEVSSKLLEAGGTTFADTVAARRQQAPYSSRVATLSVRYLPGEVRYVIRDEGPGFDPKALPDPLDVANLDKPSGRGLLLIRTFMDEVSFNERGNEITMVKRCEVAEESPQV